MTICIGICDDSPQQIQLIEGYLNSYKEHLGLKIMTSSNPKEFLTQFKNQKPHIVILDIDMGEFNGIQLGEDIKAMYGDVVIIYITGHEQYALEAFRIRAFHYLLKPLTQERFAQVFSEAVEIILKAARKKPERQKFKLQRKGLVEYIDYDTILYFEKVSRKVTIHTQNCVLDYHGNFPELLEALDARVFIQCHQGYIINKSKILAYQDKALNLEGNLRVPVSRSFACAVKEMLAKQLFGEEDDL